MFTLFSGYESQMMGLLNAVKKFNNRFKAELVGWCENDKTARLVHILHFLNMQTDVIQMSEK